MIEWGRSMAARSNQERAREECRCLCGRRGRSKDSVSREGVRLPHKEQRLSSSQCTVAMKGIRQVTVKVWKKKRWKWGFIFKSTARAFTVHDKNNIYRPDITSPGQSVVWGFKVGCQPQETSLGTDTGSIVSCLVQCPQPVLKDNEVIKTPQKDSRTQ